TNEGVSNDGIVYFSDTLAIAGNPAGSRNYYSYNAADATTTALTSTNVVSNSYFGARLNANGSRFYFVSAINYLGSGLLDGAALYELNTETGELKRQSKSMSGIALQGISVSSDGLKIIAGRAHAAGGYIRTFNIQGADEQLNALLGDTPAHDIAMSLEAFFGAVRGIGGTTISSQSSARNTLGILDNMQESISNNLLGTIGATSSRLQFTTQSLSTEATELDTALSRIRDVDYAEETANLLRLQILQQAESAVLAQANQQPGLALKLLEDI
ncbi:MAG: hypothetical protein KDD44_13830, partial [Bdellovibrionales bacterium]|nr:hypothetical protein [Bdellovibrionales bacterium]